MPLFDFVGSGCSHIIQDIEFSGGSPHSMVATCPECQYPHSFDLSWARKATHHSVHPRERAVVYTHPGTGETIYPGRNDVPMPGRYKSQGFERRELTSLREVEKFESEQGVRSEKAWFDMEQAVVLTTVQHWVNCPITWRK